VLRGLFVTGTDTGVGKTVVSAALMQRYGREVPLRYWKPIQTGAGSDDDTAEASRLGGGGPDQLFTPGVRLPDPVSPHLAARLSGTVIHLQPLLDAIQREPASTRWIVEGAGGVLVPINESELMADLMTMLQLPVVVATRTTLGTINHTLLTLEALRSRRLQIAGVVMVGPPNVSNREAIEQYGRVPVLGEMPPFESLGAEALAAWVGTGLDSGGVLRRWLE
jgi:dethiobiotin synthase